MGVMSIILAGLLSIVLGTIWYGPLFGKEWMKLMNISKPKIITPKIKKQMTASYSVQAVLSLVMATVLDFLISNNTGIFSAITVAIIAWLGLIVTTAIGSVLWEGKSVKLYFINIGYYLVLVILMTLILYYI